MDKYEVIKEYFGYTEFRFGQEQIIDNLLTGKDALCVMPTGAGKSLCYQVPALIIKGVTIVISPLISLMKDQVNSLVQSGINAAYINSSLSAKEYGEVINCASAGKYKIIYVAPERLLTDSFIKLSNEINISLIAVDEAHCVSQWGQDFRPSYLKISDYIRKLNIRPVIGAFTATATKEVKEDICVILDLHNPLNITTGFDRENLYFSVRKPDDKCDELLNILAEKKEKSGIIYCSTRKNVDEVCSFLNVKGYMATRYHAGLDDIERKINQEDFIYDRKPIMVATNAFGMGIDKSNVSFVVHYNMPMSVESYYQEAGRAGRDGQQADCILLYSGKDVKINQFLIGKTEPNPDVSELMQKAIKERDRERLKYMTYYCTTTDCLRGYILKYFGDKSQGYCGKCSNCERGYDVVDITASAQKILSCIYRTKQMYGIVTIMDILRGSKKARIVKLGLNNLSTYGIMSDVSEPKFRSIINYLLLNKYIDITKTEYPVLVMTEKSILVLKSQVKVEMKFPVIQKKKENQVKESDTDYELLSKLKEIRSKLARKASVPAYIIFSDKTLEDMCRIKPKTLDDFLTVLGVGKVKQQMYGKLFLEELNRWSDTI